MEEKSPLITEELEEQLRKALEKLEEEVTLVCVVQPGQKASHEMAGLVRHISSLSKKLSARVVDREAAPRELDTALLPLTAVYREEYTGISFCGVTGGQELNSLVLALYNAAGPGTKLDRKLSEKLSKLERKTEILVFVSLSCHHCARQVAVCQHIAAKAPGVEAKMIDARLYPELVGQYQIERIPLTVADREKRILGVKTAEEMYELIK